MNEVLQPAHQSGTLRFAVLPDEIGCFSEGIRGYKQPVGVPK